MPIRDRCLDRAFPDCGVNIIEIAHCRFDPRALDSRRLASHYNRDCPNLRPPQPNSTRWSPPLTVAASVPSPWPGSEAVEAGQVVASSAARDHEAPPAHIERHNRAAAAAFSQHAATAACPAGAAADSCMSAAAAAGAERSSQRSHGGGHRRQPTVAWAAAGGRVICKGAAAACHGQHGGCSMLPLSASQLLLLSACAATPQPKGRPLQLYGAPSCVQSAVMRCRPCS